MILREFPLDNVPCNKTYLRQVGRVPGHYLDDLMQRGRTSSALATTLQCNIPSELSQSDDLLHMRYLTKER